MADPDDPTRLEVRRAEPRRTAEVAAPSGAAGPEVSADGRYALARELARGGMGVVAEGLDGELGRPVAIKRSLADDPESINRLLREAEITARLQHPSIVPLYDLARDDRGRPLLIMRLIAGRPLHELVETTASLDERLALLPKVMPAVDALAFAHRAGVVHRDLKPGNILIGDLGDTVVIDWGLAGLVEGGAAAPAAPPPSTRGLDTLSGSVFGTPGFMAPEQARGDVVDRRADVFALGATLYFTLTGRLPFAGDSGTRLIAAALEQAARPLATIDRGIPRELCAIVDKALARSPDDRYPSAEAMAGDLRAFLAGRLVSAHRYSAAQRATRFARRHRLKLAVALVGLAATVTIVVARARTERALAAARRAQAQIAEAEARERERVDDQLTRQARAELGSDPARAVALMRLRHQRGDGTERAIALDAIGRGLAAQPRVHDRAVIGVAWLGAATALLTVGFDRQVMYTDLATGGHRRVDLGPGADAFLHGPFRAGAGDAVVVAGDRIVRIDARGAVVGRASTDAPDVQEVVVDGELVAWRAGDAIVVYDWRDGQRRTFSGRGLEAVSMAAGAVVVTDQDGARLITVADGRSRALGPLVTAEFAADGRELLIGRDGAVQRLALPSGVLSPPTEIARGLVRYGRGGVVLMTPDRLSSLEEPGWSFAGAGLGRTATGADGVAIGRGRRLDFYTRFTSHTVQLTADVTALGFAPDGRQVAVGTADGRVSRWALEPGLVARDVGAPVESVLAVGRADYVVAAGHGRAVVVSRDAVREVPTEVYPGLQRVLLTSDDRYLLLHDRKAGTVEVFEGQRAIGRVGHAAVIASADDRLLIADDRGGIREAPLATPADGRPVAELGAPVEFLGAIGPVFAARTGDGALVRRRPDGAIERAQWSGDVRGLQARPDGRVWLATAAGLVEWPLAGPPQLRHALPEVRQIHEGDGALVAATVDGRVWGVRDDRVELLATGVAGGAVFPFLHPRRVVTVDAERRAVVVDPRDGATATLPLPSFGLYAVLALGERGELVVALSNGHLLEWRDPSPADPAAVAAWVDGLIDVRLASPTAPLEWR